MESKEKPEVPGSFQQAISGPYADYWWKAMQEEMNAQKEFGTWELSPIPKAQAVITGKWHYDVKVLSESTVRFKARWVARGFTQQYGIDYNESFAPS